MDLFKQLFLIKSLKWDNINKKMFFSTKWGIYCKIMPFCCFWSIFGEIHRELFFLDTNVTRSKTITEILRKFVFLTMFEKEQILKKILICLKIFLIKPVKGDKYQQKLFFSTKWTTFWKTVFLLFWSVFVELHRELLFLDIKLAI